MRVEITVIILATVYMLLLSFCLLKILDRQGESASAWFWSMAVVFLPVLGMVLFVSFSRMAVEKEAFPDVFDTHAGMVDFVPAEMFECDAARMVAAVLLDAGIHVYIDNRTTVMNICKAMFDNLFRDIRQSCRSIDVESYIFEYDKLGYYLCELLAERAAKGVRVRVLCDAIGSFGLTARQSDHIKSSGIDIRFFGKLKFPYVTNRINHRNHRKIIVIDGKIGYTGGINIAKRYLQRTKSGVWRDMHLKVEGEAVCALQNVFEADWRTTSWQHTPDRMEIAVNRSDRINDDNFMPMQIFPSGIYRNWPSLGQTYFLAISRACRSVYIVTPYFIPDASLMRAITNAAKAGLDVVIVVPEKSDTVVTGWATRSYVEELLEAGVKVFFYCGGFNHSKYVVIDEEFCFVGSPNFDIRSFDVNYEITAVIYDRQTAKTLSEEVWDNMRNSLQITLTSWRQRSIRRLLCESAARMISPVL